MSTLETNGRNKNKICEYDIKRIQTPSKGKGGFSLATLYTKSPALQSKTRLQHTTHFATTT